MEKAANKKNKPSKKLILTAAAGLALVIGTVLLLTSLMTGSVNRSVYSERKELLGRLTKCSAGIIDDNLTYCQTIMDLFTDRFIAEVAPGSDLKEFTDSLMTNSGYADRILFFVDSAGKYYSSDASYGKLVDTEYYTRDSEDSLSYISTLPHLGNDTAYLIYRNRLASPVTVTTGHGEAEILYCGMLCDIDELNTTLSMEFKGDNNTFIFDDSNGAMLYKHFGISLLIEGYNVYPKFEKSVIINGEKAEDLIQACRNHETVVVALEINGEEYYFCSAPIAPENWSVAFIVQSKYLDEVSGSSFAKIILYIALIAIVLGVAVLALAAYIYKNTVSQRSIIEISKLNTELEKATNAKSDFLSNMSHDIRTPINGIMGMTAIAKNVEGNPEKTVECLNKIEGASGHLLSLINDVLDMSRIERGKTEIIPAPADIRTVMDNCCSIIKGQISGRDLSLTSEIDCADPYIMADELHLRQIFINILGNAVKFTPDGGEIHFKCVEKERDDTDVTLAFIIEDTGIGMSGEFIDKIFDAFTQEENSSRTKYKGTGLGMAITKQLTELMGGSIQVESEPNRGSRFTVTIPFVIDTSEHTASLASDTRTDLNGIRLLIAEDNELNMEIAVELLSDAGAELTQAENGQQALDIFSENAPGSFDAILMDIMMPVMNGLDAARAIRSLPRQDASEIPIIAMTANAFESDVQATREAGMNAHLSKPINIDEVIRTVALYAGKD